MDTIKNYFVKLYKDNRVYTLLQISYSLLAVVTLMICGVIALMNQQLGVNLLFVPCACAAILGINALIWSILKTILDSLR